MAKALNGSSEIWHLPKLRLDNNFLASDKHHLPPPELHSLDDGSVSALSRRMANSLHKNEDLNSLRIKQSQNSYASSKRAGDEFYPNPSLAQHKLQFARFQYLKQQQLIKNQLSAARRSQSIANGSRPLGFSSSASPPALKSQPASGMRAVFLNPRKESSGTGVFLPRQPGSPNEQRKKSACSTALLPARVVQALNLNLDELCFYPRAPSHGMGLTGNQKRSSSSSNRSPWVAGAVDRLPPEWTY